MEYYNLTVICSKVHAESLHIFFFLSFIYFFSSRKSVHFNMQKFKPHEFYMIQGARLCAHRGPCEQRVQTTGSRGEVDVYSTGLHHQWLSNHEQSPRSTSAPFTEIIYRSAHRRDTIFRVTVHRARMQCDVPTGIKEFFFFF